MLEIEKLISLVHGRTPLWDISSQSYHNRDVGRRLWHEIAEELNTTIEVVKTKWHSLRDTFRKEHMKISKKKTGSASVCDTHISSWKFYYQLLFLVDVCSPRQTKTNIPESSQCSLLSDLHSQQEDSMMASDLNINNDIDSSTISCDIQDGEMIGDTSQKDHIHNKIPINFTSTHMPMKRKKTIARSDAINQLLEMEQKKIVCMEKMNSRRDREEEEKKDEDYHFLMSLLPHFREIPKRLKLETKIEIQKILLNAVRAQEVESSNSPTRLIIEM